jgi:hypothetical protein
VVRIIAALCWYDEDPAFLTRIVRSLNGVADHLVAVGGRWELFPEAEHDRADDEIAALEAAAAAIGLEMSLHERLVGAWPSQVEKRDRMMQWAAEHGDWILVVDGDEEITRADMDVVRAELEATDLHVAQALTVPMNRSWPYSEMPTHPRPVRKLYRAGTRVERAHNGYRFDGEWLQGDTAHVVPAEALDLSASLHVAHDNANRGKDRNGRSKTYRKQRREERVEAWI